MLQANCMPAYSSSMSSMEKRLERPSEDGNLAGTSVHGVDVGEVDDGRFVAEVFQRDVGEVEVYAFEQQVGGDEGALVAVVEYGGVVAYPFEGRGISSWKILGEVPYETKLAEGGKYRFRGLFSMAVRIVNICICGLIVEGLHFFDELPHDEGHATLR